MKHCARISTVKYKCRKKSAHSNLDDNHPNVRAVSPVSGVCHVMCQSRKQDLKSVNHDDSMNRCKCTKYKLAKGIKFIPPMELNLFRNMIQEKLIAHVAAYDLIWRLLL